MLEQKKTTVPQRTVVLSQAVVEAARRLGIGPTDVGQIVGVSQPTASRLLNGEYSLKESSKEWELSAHLVRLYRSLFSLVGGDDDLARGWMRSANKAFADQPPINVIKRIDGLLHVCEHLDAYRARV